MNHYNLPTEIEELDYELLDKQTLCEMIEDIACFRGISYYKIKDDIQFMYNPAKDLWIKSNGFDKNYSIAMSHEEASLLIQKTLEDKKNNYLPSGVSFYILLSHSIGN